MNRKTSFTLIELLVVIAIIAVLMSMLLPSLTKSRDMARRAGCSSNMKQVGVGFTSYAGDFGGFLPAKGGGDGPYWYNNLQLNGYTGPSPKGWHPSGAGARAIGIWACPASSLGISPSDSYCCDYGKNPNTGESSTNPGTSILNNVWKQISSASMPSRIFYAVDSASYSPPYTSFGRDIYQYIGSGTAYPSPGGSAPRHSNRANMIYLDGHTQTINPYDSKDFPNAANGYSWQNQLPWGLTATQ